MEHFSVTKTDDGFHIEGFPNAVKVVRINGPNARRFSDLTLHDADLAFAAECLKAINLVPDEPLVIRQALWRSAVIHYMKCFGENNARSTLNAKEIYEGNPQVFEAFAYFKNLRNKHFVHDENSYAQSIPGAVLNQRNKPYKVEKIVCVSVIAETLEQDNYTNLRLLIQTAKTWVEGESDVLCQALTNELEAKPYDALYSLEAITYKVPVTDEINKHRNTP